MKEDWPMRSVGMVVGGSILTGAGGIGLIASIYLLNSSSVTCSVDGSTCSDNGKKTAGFVVLLVSGAAIGVGIPLIIAGRKKVPPKPDPGATATLHLGPRGGALAFQF